MQTKIGPFVHMAQDKPVSSQPEAEQLLNDRFDVGASFRVYLNSYTCFQTGPHGSLHQMQWRFLQRILASYLDESCTNRRRISLGLNQT